MKKRKKARNESTGGEEERRPAPSRTRQVPQAAVAKPATFVGTDLVQAYTGAVACPVPVTPRESVEQPVWMRRLHETFPYLHDQWERARRRPDREEPDKGARVLAHNTGTTPAKLVVYVAYDRMAVDSVLDALVRAAAFAALCGARSIAMGNPRSMGAVSGAEAITATLRKMSQEGDLKVVVHNSTHRPKGERDACMSTP